MVKTYCFDLDNTLCETQGTDYPLAKPIYEHINKVNDLYNEGNHIIIQTGRGALSGINWLDLTAFQLKEWGVKYHELTLKKVVADVYVDDLAYNTKDFFK